MAYHYQPPPVVSPEEARSALLARSDLPQLFTPAKLASILRPALILDEKPFERDKPAKGKGKGESSPRQIRLPLGSSRKGGAVVDLPVGQAWPRDESGPVILVAQASGITWRRIPLQLCYRVICPVQINFDEMRTGAVQAIAGHPERVLPVHPAAKGILYLFEGNDTGERVVLYTPDSRPEALHAVPAPPGTTWSGNNGGDSNSDSGGSSDGSGDEMFGYLRKPVRLVPRFAWMLPCASVRGRQGVDWFPPAGEEELLTDDTRDKMFDIYDHFVSSQGYSVCTNTLFGYAQSLNGAEAPQVPEFAYTKDLEQLAAQSRQARASDWRLLCQFSDDGSLSGQWCVFPSV
jgi:hypothetical protein